MNKITWAVITIVVLGAVGYYWYQNNTSQLPTAMDTMPTSYSWFFEGDGVNEDNQAPITAVTLTAGERSIDAGRYEGSCFVIETSDWQLQAGEKSGVICWFAGGGSEIGVFEENGKIIVKVGDIDEGDAETPGFRGNFKTILELN